MVFFIFYFLNFFTYSVPTRMHIRRRRMTSHPQTRVDSREDKLICRPAQEQMGVAHIYRWVWWLGIAYSLSYTNLCNLFWQCVLCVPIYLWIWVDVCLYPTLYVSPLPGSSAPLHSPSDAAILCIYMVNGEHRLESVNDVEAVLNLWWFSKYFVHCAVYQVAFLNRSRFKLSEKAGGGSSFYLHLSATKPLP